MMQIPKPATGTGTGTSASAGALLFWLLRERKTEFITQHDEDDACVRLRELMNGSRFKQKWWGRSEEQSTKNHKSVEEFTDDERWKQANSALQERELQRIRRSHWAEQ